MAAPCLGHPGVASIGREWTGGVFGRGVIDIGWVDASQIERRLARRAGSLDVKTKHAVANGDAGKFRATVSDRDLVEGPPVKTDG